MTRVAPALPALALGAAAAIALASCGGGGNAKLLPGTTAAQITENLKAVRELAAEGDCISAKDEAQQVSAQVGDLQGIDPKLKEALQEGAAKLNEVVLTCSEETAEEPAEETEPTTETATKPEKEKKPQKEKPEPSGQKETEASEAPEEPTAPTPPNGEAKGHEEAGEGAGPGPPSGGIGPGSETGGGG